MANPEHVELLRRDGVEVWNQWRDEHQDVQPDLSGAVLNLASFNGVDFSFADLKGAELTLASLIDANLFMADLTGARLDMANLSHAYLFMAKFASADLSKAVLISAYLASADLSRADLSYANLHEANLSDADLNLAICVEANLSGATLTGCNIYGVSAWDVNLEGAVQADLRITPPGNESHITVDNLEVAQFLYLLLHNEKIRAVLDTITSKVVLILGRFSDERKPILDALREALRRHSNGYIPVLFDFEPQASKPVLETVKTLANLARFIIADLTDPHMIRAELTAIIPNVPTVPIQPIIQAAADAPTEYESWILFKSFLPVYRYTDLAHLLASLTDSVITPVEGHVQARRL